MRRMKANMRNYGYSPGMDKYIENMVKPCKSCASVAKPTPIKFNPWSETEKLWSRIHIDYAGPIKGKYIFVIVDSITKKPKVFKCQKPTTKTTIKVLQELFAKFGLPHTMVSDNGTPFISKEFENFRKLLSINHLKSAPYHPIWNELVERFIDVFKRAIKRQRGSWCNCYCRRKWPRRHEFKTWTRLIAFHITLISLGKVWIQLFSIQLWVNSRADWVLHILLKEKETSYLRFCTEGRYWNIWHFLKYFKEVQLTKNETKCCWTL